MKLPNGQEHELNTVFANEADGVTIALSSGGDIICLSLEESARLGYMLIAASKHGHEKLTKALQSIHDSRGMK